MEASLCAGISLVALICGRKTLGTDWYRRIVGKKSRISTDTLLRHEWLPAWQTLEQEMMLLPISYIFIFFQSLRVHMRFIKRKTNKQTSRNQCNE